MQPASITVADKSATVPADRTKTCQEKRHPLRTGAVGLVYECAPGKIVTELLFSHQNDAQLLLTENAKASRNTEGVVRAETGT